MIMESTLYDIAIIGGGINGCGIARDAAGRGLSVFLCEQNDLASGTSSASTKLIHGGLRYLEYYQFRLVREALREREILLRTAPHIVWPLRFILPHHRGLRPAWLIRLGLFLYDHIGGRKILQGTSRIDLRHDERGKPLKKQFNIGFAYSDCRVMDSRLVVLNCMDGAAKGAEIRTRTKLLTATRTGQIWHLRLLDKVHDTEFQIRAKVLINASGPWLNELLTHISHSATKEQVRMVKGSHIIVDALFTHDHGYIFQNEDSRIIFAIPFENRFTLIGTTDLDFDGDPGRVSISAEETDYLCDAASEYFIKKITKDDVLASFSGIRPLFDDGRSEAKAATRDYVLKLDRGTGEAPLLSLYGGKITTYRKLAESVLEKISAFFPEMGPKWTEQHQLPGGGFSPDNFMGEVQKFREHMPFLPPESATRLFRTYGSRVYQMTSSIKSVEQMAKPFGHDLHPFEVDYLIDNEWARCAEDILWRRTKLGLFFSPDQEKDLENYIRQKQGAT